MKTKNFILFIMASSLFLSGLKAQELRIQAGFNFPDNSPYGQKSDESEVFSLKLGFLIGPTLEFKINEINKLKTGTLINLKGFNRVSSKEIGEYLGYNDKWNLLYLDVPILYCRNFNLGKISFQTEIGPYAGIGLHGKYKAGHYLNKELEFEEYIILGKNNIGYLKTMDYGLQFGLNTFVKSCQFGMSFSLGLRDIATPDYNEIKNRVFTIYASYPLFSW